MNEGQPAGAPLSPPMTAMPSGGTPMMGMNAGGAPGMTPPAMGAAGAPPITPPPLTLVDLVGDLDGHLFSVACGDTPNTDDCNGEG